jgi:hypothetical protein
MMGLPRILDKNQFSQLSGLAILDFEINLHTPNWIPSAEFLAAPSGASPVKRVHLIVVWASFNAVPPAEETLRPTSGKLLV